MMVELYLRKVGFSPLPTQAATSGVYALLRGKEVLYIGLSKNVYARVSAHYQMKRRRKPYLNMSAEDSRNKVIPFDRVLVKWCQHAEAKIIEAELLNIYLPPFNTRVEHPIRDYGINLESLFEATGIQLWTERRKIRPGATEFRRTSPPSSQNFHRRFG